MGIYGIVGGSIEYQFLPIELGGCGGAPETVRRVGVVA